MTGANKHQCYFSEMTLSRLQKSIQHTNSIKCNNNILCCFIIKLTSFKLKQERKKKRERERKDFEVQLLSMNYHRNFLKYKIFPTNIFFEYSLQWEGRKSGKRWQCIVMDRTAIVYADNGSAV